MPIPAYSHRQIWIIAAPLILSNISIPLVGAVDTAVIGQLPGINNIAAVALGAVIFDFLFWGFNFLKLGTSGLTAQALGAGRDSNAADHISRALVMAVICAGLIIVFQKPIITFILSVYNPEQAVYNLTSEYYQIRILGAPAVFINYVILGTLIALQKTVYIFAHQLILNITNVVLDLVFVMMLDEGVSGVAKATIIANYSACFIGIHWLVKITHKNHISISVKKVIQENLIAFLPLLKMNMNIMIRTACLVFSFAYLTYQSNQLGTLFLAANAILLHLQTIMAYGLDGFADAVESLSGRAYGKRSKPDFIKAVKNTSLWSAITAGGFCLVYYFFGENMIDLFSIDETIINTAKTYLPWLIVSPLICVWSFQLDGIYNGTTHTRDMRNGMLIATLTFIMSSYFLIPQWHNHGLWLSFLVFMLARMVILAGWFHKITDDI